MAEHELHGEKPSIGRILIEIILPALCFGGTVGLATRDYPASLVTGLAISGAIFVLSRVDQAFLKPHLQAVRPDWLQVGLEMTFSLLEHVLGAILALVICSRLLAFRVVPSSAWWAVAGIVVVFPIIHGTETALRYFRQLREKERLEKELRTLATQAELRALKAQINPHFLFNTLNTIAQLVHTDPAKAEATIERLAQMLRYVLAGSERVVVPLAEELTFVDSYLTIEQARFGDRLHVNREVPSQIQNVLVPSLILQPLVENAVRHGRGQDGRVELTIRVQPEGSQVSVAIADQGPGMPSQYAIGQSRGFGLRNVDQRLRATYGPGYGIELRENEPRGTVVTVRFPV